MFGSSQHRDEEMGLPVGLGVGPQLLKEVIKNIYKFVGGVERHRTPVYMIKNMKIKQTGQPSPLPSSIGVRLSSVCTTGRPNPVS